MKRFAMACAAAAAGLALVGGCEGGSGPKMNDPFASKAAMTAAAPAKTPAQADYFEVKKDGKTYVLGSNASREAFNNGQMPAFKETAFDNGKSALVENSNYTDYNRLVAEYKKAKGL
jgi:hypothetical protein